ncbi:MAG: glutamate 5-kinase [Parcubacteria group bacterium]|nr:glutamate 5-kinase [Parcubacteria group bacterium]
MKEILTIKVGTNVLTENSGNLSEKRIKNIVQQIAQLIEKGYKISLVTSGAVGAGKEITQEDFDNEKNDIKKSCLAAIGQANLMKIYNQLFSQHKIKTAQLLLTREDFSNRYYFLHLKEVINSLLDKNIVPIINENDVLTTPDITFGENDRLSAGISIITKSDKLIILTNADGFYDCDPHGDKNAKLIGEVKDINREVIRCASGSMSSQGKGGMVSKLKAIRLTTKASIESYVINGLEDNTILNLLDNKKIGTKFIKSDNKIKERERWLLTGCAMAKIMIDDGAVGALQKRNSLLFIGVRKICGEFTKGEIVEIINSDKDTMGYGMLNYSSYFLEMHQQDPKAIKKEIINADNITLF